MQTYYLEPNQVPRQLLQVMGYRGCKYQANITEILSLSNMQWDGGSRNSYMAINLATGEQKPLSDPRPWPQNMSALPDYPMKSGVVVAQHIIFCGKDLGIRFHVHPDDVTKLLPDNSDSALTQQEKVVLAYTQSLKSSYGGIKNYRFVEANRKEAITLEQWEQAKTTLIASGHLRKNGAITPTGRNVDTGIRVY